MEITRRTLLQSAALGAGLMAVPGITRSGADVPLPSVRPGGPAEVGGLRVLAGSLHDHSIGSDGDTLAEPVVEWMAQHHQEIGVDFATLSDHSDFFPVQAGYAEIPANKVSGIDPSKGAPCDPSDYNSCGVVMPDPADPTYVAEMWLRQARLQEKYDGPGFSFLRGFEWTNDQQNHMDVLLSSNWTSRATTGDASLSMKPFWEWFNAEPVADPTGYGLGFGGRDGVGMFNHPGDKGALNWDDYGLDADAAERMCLIEIHGEQGRSGRNRSDAGWYWFALAKGWTVSPVMNWDWHEWKAGGVIDNPQPGTGYGEHGYLPGQRSLVVAADARRASIREALSARRTSASETPDLWATLRTADGTWMGSEVAAAPGSSLQLVVDCGSLDGVYKVEVVSDNGVGIESYLGDNASWSSPHSQLTPSFVAQHAKWVATGSSTRKGRIDTAPAGTTVASVETSAPQVGLTVTVPTAPSPRPDGKHFFYAVVYAGDPADPARCWTGPILTH